MRSRYDPVSSAEVISPWASRRTNSTAFWLVIVGRLAGELARRVLVASRAASKLAG